MLFSLDNSLHPYVRLIGRVRYTAAWKHFERTVPEYILYLMIDGKMAIEENGSEYTLSRGDYLLLEPDLSHRGLEMFPCEYYYVHFRHEGLKRADGYEAGLINEILEKRHVSLISYGLSDTLPTDTITYLSKTGSLAQCSTCIRLFEMGIEEYYKRLEQYRPAMADLLSLTLLELSREYVTRLYASESKSRYSRGVSKALALIRYLHDNYSRKITGESLEAEMETNIDHLNRVFKKLCGQTIFAYLNNIRVNHAKDLIGQTSLPFSEIAYLVGFDDTGYFTKFFKKHTGTTPSQYWKLAHRDKLGDEP